MQEVLDEIISELEPENVPAEFIVSARYTCDRGIERTVTGDEFVRLIAAGKPLYNVRIVLDVRAMKRAILNELSTIYGRVNAGLRDAARYDGLCDDWTGDDHIGG